MEYVPVSSANKVDLHHPACGVYLYILSLPPDTRQMCNRVARSMNYMARRKSFGYFTPMKSAVCKSRLSVCITLYFAF